MSQTLRYDFINSIIEVPTPDTTLDLQYLVDQTRDMEDELHPSMAYPKIMDAYGKQALGGGTFVGITVMLLDDWKVKFEARSGPDTVVMSITGGNLVAESGNPIAPSAYTTVTLAQSSSPTIATPNENVNLKYLIGLLSGSQNMAIGSMYYWDPVSGSDTNDGTQPSTAVATFAQAQTLVTDTNNDIVFCVVSDPSGVTTTTETINITKTNLKLRGPGYSFQIIPTSDTDDTITVTADGVEVSGIYIETAATGTQNALTITGDYAWIKDCWVANVRGHGISISSSDRTRINNCAIEACGGSGTGNGINIGNSVTRNMISKCIISDNVNGVALSGTGISDNILENNLIYNHTAYGITVGSGVSRTHVRSGHTFSSNTSGNTQDLGTNTYIETQAGGASASEIADAVWDEVLTAGHTDTGSAAKILKDTKTKATLASLK